MVSFLLEAEVFCLNELELELELMLGLRLEFESMTRLSKLSRTPLASGEFIGRKWFVVSWKSRKKKKKKGIEIQEKKIMSN